MYERVRELETAVKQRGKNRCSFLSKSGINLFCSFRRSTGNILDAPDLEMGQVLGKLYSGDEVVETGTIVAEVALKDRFSLTEINRHGVRQLLCRNRNRPRNQRQDTDYEGFKIIFHIA